MIEFACRCGLRMPVEDDQAGVDLQCPRCGILGTVPTLSDGRAMAADGTYAMDDDTEAGAERRRADRLSALHQAFTRNTIDADGAEIDNRVTFEELALAGEIPIVDETERPKYDPITGELVRPLAIKVDPKGPNGDADDIPMAQAAITYAAAPPRSTNLASAMVLLATPGNLVVLGIMLVLHLLMQGIAALTMIFFFVGIIGIPLAFGVIGHLANVIDEIGPRDMDELPRPLRDLQFGEDLWHPFVHMAVALALCFGPAYLALTRLHHLPQAVLFLAIVATLFVGVVAFPGVLITTCTSGTLLNLRPDRVLSVAGAGGPSYLGLIFMGLLAAGTYVAGNAGVFMWLCLPTGSTGHPFWINGFVSHPMMALGVYLMHLFCWRCGLYYRQHHADFNWVFQRHQRTTRASEDPAIRAARRTAQRQAALARRGDLRGR